MIESDPAPLPQGTRLQADPSLRRRDRGRLLIGGNPLRFIRLSDAGSATVSRWLSGAPIGRGAGPQALARRLVAAGMTHPIPPQTLGDLSDLTVVIPVKDDPDGLAATLATLPADVAVVVVDDGSEPPVDRPSVERLGELIRRPDAGGPGIARQRALPAVATPLVAFVDAGVELEPTSLRRLTRWFGDRAIVAVGPRVASKPGMGMIARYDRHRSPLDLGPTPAAVGRSSPVTYLPTACLVVRRDAIEAVGGFDPALRWGEDVDLVWRLAERGDVRFDPSVEVEHPARPTLRAFMGQRLGYGSAAGPLAMRHPGRLAPARSSGWSLACWALALVGKPGAGLLLATGTAVALCRKLTGTIDDPAVEAFLLTGRGHLHAGRSLARTATRTWWPIIAIAWLAGARRSVARTVALSLIDRWLTAVGSGPDRILDLGLGVLDDAAYGAGVWRGAFGARTLEPLLPELVNWPPRDGDGD